MLGSVIHKHTVNIFHSRNQSHIGNEYYYSHNTLEKRMKFLKIAARHKVDKPRRKPHKQEKCEPESEHGGNNAYDIHHFRPETVVKPAVEFRHILLVFGKTLSGFFSRLHKIPVAGYE